MVESIRTYFSTHHQQIPFGTICTYTSRYLLFSTYELLLLLAALTALVAVESVVQLKSSANHPEEGIERFVNACAERFAIDEKFAILMNNPDLI